MAAANETNLKNHENSNDERPTVDAPANAVTHKTEQGSSRISRSPSTETHASLYSLQAELRNFMDVTDSTGYQVYPGTERIQYDFTGERVGVHFTGLIESTAHLIKGSLGAGILTMHEGFMFGGLWTSLIAAILFGTIVAHAMLMLVKSAHKMYGRLRVPRLTYPDLAEAAVATGPWKAFRQYSKTCRYTVDVCLLIEMCGTCCIYEIIIASTIKQAMESISPSVKEMHLSIRIYILIITAPLLALCMIRSLKYLAPFSLVADVFVLLCVITTMYYSIVESGNMLERPAWKSVHGLIRFSGIYLYSIDGIAVTLPVENNMKNPRYFRFILKCAMATVITMTTMTGFFGYWGWGENCQSPITRHMPENTFSLITQFLLATMLSVTFAVHFWIPFRVVWHYIGKKYKSKRVIWERIYRLIHIVLITCLSVAFPHLIHLIIFIGNFFIGLITFVFPAFIESLVTWREPRQSVIRWRLVKNSLILLLGITLSCCAFYSAIDAK